MQLQLNKYIKSHIPVSVLNLGCFENELSCVVVLTGQFMRPSVCVFAVSLS